VDAGYGIRSYLLTTKCIYELKKEESYQELEKKCKSFKQYLHRKLKDKEINKRLYDIHIGFIKIVLLLPRTSSSKYAQTTKGNLLEKVKATQSLMSHAWLLEKIEALS